MQEWVSPCNVEWGFPLCVDGLLSRTPDELFEVLLSDYSGYEVMKRTKGRREVTEEDEKQAELLCQSFRKQWEEEET